MIIIHHVATLPRAIAGPLAQSLGVMPVVAVVGARQTGKSTLAQLLVPGRRSYRSLDDLDVLDAARRDPEVLVGGTEPLTLDEVQRAPESQGQGQARAMTLTGSSRQSRGPT